MNMHYRFEDKRLQEIEESIRNIETNVRLEIGDKVVLNSRNFVEQKRENEDLLKKYVGTYDNRFIYQGLFTIVDIIYTTSADDEPRYDGLICMVIIKAVKKL